MIIDELVTLLGVDLAPDAQSKLQTFSKGISGIVTQLKWASAAFTGTALAAGAFFKNVVDEAAALNTLSEQTGISAERLQEWEYAANALGVSASAVAGDLAKMEQQAAWTGRSLESYADSFKGLNARQAAARGQMLGLSPDSIRLLREGRDGLARLKQEARDLGAIIPEEDIRRAADLKKGINELQYVFKGVTSIVMLSAVPAVRQVVDGIKEWVKENRALIGQHVERFATGLISAFVRIKDVLKQVWDRIKPAGDQLNWLWDILNDGELYIHLLTGAFGLLLILFAPLIAKAVALGAIFTALSLIVEDFITYMEGGQSVIGRMIDSFTEEFPALASLIKSTLGAALKFVKATLSGGVEAAKILFGWLSKIAWVFGKVIDGIAYVAQKTGNVLGDWINESGEKDQKAWADAHKTAKDGATLYKNGGAGIPAAGQQKAENAKSSQAVQQTVAAPAARKTEINDNRKTEVNIQVTASDPQQAAQQIRQEIQNVQQNTPGIYGATTT